MTDVVRLMIDVAQGAATLDLWLIRVGIGIVGFAGWLVVRCTWFT